MMIYLIFVSTPLGLYGSMLGFLFKGALAAFKKVWNDHCIYSSLKAPLAYQVELLSNFVNCKQRIKNDHQSR